MPVRSIEAEYVKRGFPFGRINNLADPEQRLIARNFQKICGCGGGGGGVHFLVGISDLNPIAALQNRKQGSTRDQATVETGELIGRQIASLSARSSAN